MRPFSCRRAAPLTLVVLTGCLLGSAPLAFQFFPSSIEVLVGRSQEVQVTVVDESGNRQEDIPVSFSSSNESVFTVSAGGTVTGTGPGRADLMVVGGDVSGQIPVAVEEVTIDVAQASVSVAIDRGEQLSVTLRDGSGTVVPGNPVYSSAASAVATVTDGGVIQGRIEGSTFVRVSEPGTEQSVDVPVTVTAAVPSVAGTWITTQPDFVFPWEATFTQDIFGNIGGTVRRAVDYNQQAVYATYTVSGVNTNSGTVSMNWTAPGQEQINFDGRAYTGRIQGNAIAASWSSNGVTFSPR